MWFKSSYHDQSFMLLNIVKVDYKVSAWHNSTFVNVLHIHTHVCMCVDIPIQTGIYIYIYKGIIKEI